MGGQQSQPQPGVKLIGVGGGGGGGFGKIAENLAAGKITFDPNTGALTREVQSGTTQSSMRMVPDDKIDLGSYISELAKWTKAGTAQNPNMYPAASNMIALDAIGTQVGAESISKELPSVTAWQIKNPPVRAVVYTDQSGDSKFLYKNDPGNVVQLVKGGSKVAAGVSQGAMVSETKSSVMRDQCAEFRKLTAMCGAASAVPAPAAGTSTYAIQGEVYPIQAAGGYPMWVIILIIAILIGTLIFVKNS